MMKKKRVFILAAIAAVLCLLFSLPIQLVSTSSDDREKIVFWHEMTGSTKDTLVKLVDDFNNSQDKYEVVPYYQGTYEEVVQKVLNTYGTDASPTVFQSADNSIAQLYDSGCITPIQTFVDKESYDIEQIYPVARNFYSYDDELFAMPFNTSQPVLYYNKSLLEEHGITLSPKEPTYSDLSRVAKELKEKAGNSVSGMSLIGYSWYFEEFAANAGVTLVDNNNGRDGTVTKATYNSTAMQETLSWIQEGMKAGYFTNYGSGSTAMTNELTAFLSGKTGLMVRTSGACQQIFTGTDDEIGICYYPHPDGQENNGVSIGGAALWISNDKSQAQQEGAWAFIKYMLSAESQATWQAGTGYLALNKGSQFTDTLLDMYKENPALAIPSQQLATTEPNKANAGIFMQGMNQSRLLLQTAMEQVFNGADVKKALSEAEKSMDNYITQNNLANGK